MRGHRACRPDDCANSYCGGRHTQQKDVKRKSPDVSFSVSWLGHPNFPCAAPPYLRRRPPALGPPPPPLPWRAPSLAKQSQDKLLKRLECQGRRGRVRGRGPPFLSLRRAGLFPWSGGCRTATRLARTTPDNIFSIFVSSFRTWFLMRLRLSSLLQRTSSVVIFSKRAAAPNHPKILRAHAHPLGSICASKRRRQHPRVSASLMASKGSLQICRDP